MKLFRDETTDGYNKKEIDELNKEWEEIVKNEGLEEYTDEYNERAKQFSDEVCSR